MSGKTGMPPSDFAFSSENKKLAKVEIAKYPKGRQASAVMPLLFLAQGQAGGWLSTAAMDHVAEVLDMPPIRVYEVATFYSMYNLKPMGKHHVQVCTNLPCWLKGSDEVVASCRETLGVDWGETTQDGLFSLSEVECLGACANAPMMQINDAYYEDLTAESTAAVLDALAKGEKPKAGPQSGRRGSEPAGGPTTLQDYIGDG